MKLLYKFLTGFLIVAILGSIIGIMASNNMTKIVDTTQDVIDNDVKSTELIESMRTNVESEMKSIYQFIWGDETAKETITSSHEKFELLATEAKTKLGSHAEQTLNSVLESEKKIYDVVASNEDSLVVLKEKQQNARDGFINKNNKHLIRTSEYIKYWGTELSFSGSTKGEIATEILANIQSERNAFWEYNPNRDNAEEQKQIIRDSNDFVVDNLISLWVDHVDSQIKWIEESEMADTYSLQKDKLVALKNVGAKITSTSFPIVREDIAALCGISAHSSVVTKSDDSNHEDETKTVQSASENIIKELEAAGITTAQRQYVKKVSKDETDLVTPTFVLLKIVTCQQGLRMNAEDYFSSSEGINDNINNVLNVEQEKLETKLNELAKEVQESLQSSKSNVLALSKSSQENQKMVSIVLIILSVILALFFANMITKPVQKLTNAANKLTKGELDVKLLDKKTGDEIDNLNEGLQGVLGAIKFLSEEVESKQKGKK